jgi:hypothetical protein
MPTEANGILSYVLSVLLFPMYFQESFILFAWGAGDVAWLMLCKRIFLLLPVFAIILGCWVTIVSVITTIFRHDRRSFVLSLFINWWDLGKAVVSFWGGIFKFFFYLAAGILGFLKIFILALWALVQEVIFMPFRLLGSAGRGLVRSSIPWIAVVLTIFWCLLEGIIFTYVMTPLVVDTFSNITGEQLTEGFIRIPLFIFLLFIILGSYAVLSNMVEAVKKKNISAIIGIGVIEIVALFVEVVFLYREFVDSLVPWFAQYSENFELGIFWTLAIAIFAWFGIRSLSWFLFAEHGTPTILAIIQGKGLAVSPSEASARNGSYMAISSEFMGKIKEDTRWLQEKGEELLAAFMLPPLQVVAAAINFGSVLIISHNIFNIPFKTMDDIKLSKEISDVMIKKPEAVKQA